MSEFNLEKLTIHELVDRRNADCMHNGWGNSRGRFHVELREAFSTYGLEIKDFSWYTYIKYWDGKLLLCDKPRYRITALNLDGTDSYLRHICCVQLQELHLARILTPKLVFLEEDRSVSFEINDTTKRFQIVSLDNNQVVIGNATVIGHLGQRFTQQVYGRIILVIPFDGNQLKRLALGQKLKLKLIENSDNTHAVTKYL